MTSPQDADKKRVQRDRHFWSDLNRFVRSWMEANGGRRPEREVLQREFNNNKDAWFVQKGKVVPSLEDVLKQAKGVRLLEEQRAYMRQYRVDKKNDSKELSSKKRRRSTSVAGPAGSEGDSPPPAGSLLPPDAGTDASKNMLGMGLLPPPLLGNNLINPLSLPLNPEPRTFKQQRGDGCLMMLANEVRLGGAGDVQDPARMQLQLLQLQQQQQQQLSPLGLSQPLSQVSQPSLGPPLGLSGAPLPPITSMPMPPMPPVTAAGLDALSNWHMLGSPSAQQQQQQQQQQQGQQGCCAADLAQLQSLLNQPPPGLGGLPLGGLPSSQPLLSTQQLQQQQLLLQHAQQPQQQLQQQPLQQQQNQAPLVSQQLLLQPQPQLPLQLSKPPTPALAVKLEPSASSAGNPAASTIAPDTASTAAAVGPVPSVANPAAALTSLPTTSNSSPIALLKQHESAAGGELSSAPANAAVRSPALGPAHAHASSGESTSDATLLQRNSSEPETVSHVLGLNAHSSCGNGFGLGPAGVLPAGLGLAGGTAAPPACTPAACTTAAPPTTAGMQIIHHNGMAFLIPQAPVVNNPLLTVPNVPYPLQQ